jgi:AraC family transcriptional regulator
MEECTVWPDVRVSLIERTPGPQEVRSSDTLSVALLPVARAAWRVDCGATIKSRISPGTTFIWASRAIFRERLDETCKCIHVTLAPRLLEKVARDFGANAAELGYCGGHQDLMVYQCALGLAEVASNGGRAGELYVQSIANTLAVHLLRRYAGTAIPQQRPASVGVRLERAKDYIEANLARTLSLDSIAEAAALSPYHFARTFKSALGLSPHRYVIRRRIEQAKVLLVSTSMPLLEVGRHVGIPNQSHFTTHFRKLVGCTPREFRRQGQ